MDSIIKKSKAMRGKFPDKSPNDSLENSHEQPPDGSLDKPPDKASDTSSEVSTVESYRAKDSSSSYSSNDTVDPDIRETQLYIASSDKERRRLLKRDRGLQKRADQMRLRRKIKAGKKAAANEREDLAIWSDIRMDNWSRVAEYDVEALRIHQCRAAEDGARDLSGAEGADGRKWGDYDQRVLELQRINDDYIKLAVELLSWRHWHYEGKKTLHYRADEVNKLMHIFDRQWRETYQRIGDNLEKIREQAKHSAGHDTRGLDIEKESKVADEIVRSDEGPNTGRPSPTKKPRAHAAIAAKPHSQQPEITPQKLRRSKRLLALETGRKN